MVPLLGLTRYTGPARQVLLFAEQQALADGDPAISTGDMLLGLLRTDHAVAAAALESLGITAGAVRRQLADITRSDEDGASSWHLPADHLYQDGDGYLVAHHHRPDPDWSCRGGPAANVSGALSVHRRDAGGNNRRAARQRCANSFYIRLGSGSGTEPAWH